MRSVTISRKQKVNAGFSLIELLVTISILLILLTIAAPSFQQIMHRMRSSSTISDLQNTIHLARSEATKRKQNTVICKSTDGSTCTTTGTYAQGYIAFVDINRNGEVDLPEDIALQVNGEFARAYSLIGTAEIADRLRFNRTGHLILATVTTEPNLTLCQSGNPDGKRLHVTPNGRTRMEDITTC